MAYTTIDDPSAHFQVATYSGTGSTQSVGNDGNSNLKPDWVWIKERNNSGTNHSLFDSSRGATKELITNVIFQKWVATPQTLHRPAGLESREARPAVMTPPNDLSRIEKHLGSFPISM